ncbi:MAG: carboxypeptidase regulatory-like domain-containing protein [Acidobacteria bacterium]|nr:carboxypeptidase regulatory-like domain-containing protein [Acidobacteriota bacterium]
MSAEKSSRMRWGSLAVAIVAALVAQVPVIAQIGTGTIEVAVAEEAGTPLPGVIVVATSEQTSFKSEAVTDANGFARLAALDPGTYAVQFTAQGYATLVQRDVVLRVGQSIRLRIQLGAQMTEELTVKATAPLVDVYKTDSSTNIIPEQIEELPVQSREFERLAFITPGVQRERGAFRFIQGGPVIGSGGNASQSTIFVDGVDLTDPALGLSRARFLPGRDPGVPRDRQPLRRRDRRLGRRRALDRHQVGHERVRRQRLRLLPRRVAAHQG